MQNKKIKIITCHDVYNVGASLQAYALRKYFEQLGYDAETIDYKPDYLSMHYPLWGCDSAKFNKPFIRTAYSFAKLPSRLIARLSKRKKSFDDFTKKHLKLTKRYSSNVELKNDPPYADVYFAGSDQIWNTIFPNGKDPAFYLNFAPEGTVRASYAASFATKEIKEEWKEKVVAWLSRMDYISVREKSGLEILKNLGIDNGKLVLDPVFLLEKSEWEILTNSWRNPEKEPYILLYDFDNNPKIYKFAKKLAQINGWKVVSILKNKFVKNCYANDGPAAFLSLVKGAQVVISNSFHATAFSLIFEREFYVFNRNEEINVRMHDMLNFVGLQDRLEPKDKANGITFSIVKKNLSKAINESKRYIEVVLSGGEID